MSIPRPGISFRETMQGAFMLGMTDPVAGAAAGRKAGIELAMHASITIEDMEAFVADPHHGGHIIGTIDFPPLGVGMVAHTGVFRLFSPTADAGTRHMVYELGFEVQGKARYLAGHKVVRNDPGFDLWSDTTTLHTTLHDGQDSDGPIIAAGILELSPAALMRLLASVRAVNAPRAADKARVIARFGEFFSGKLAEMYLRPAAAPHAAPEPMADVPAPAVWDVAVIGSGFGGAVMACRLAEAGQRVLILERGRRWDPASLPRSAGGDAWWWDARRPQDCNGWLDLRLFDKVGVAQGAAVGGGSHIYANISVEPPAQVFDHGWPEGVNHSALKPHMNRVAEFMGVAPVPPNQWPERTRIMQEAAAAVGAADRFRQVGLAVSFDPEAVWDGRSSMDRSRSVSFINRHGVRQGTCYHCGLCDLGCDVQAKNTLDLNYLAVAERHRCEIRPLHLVSHIEPDQDGYIVHFDRLDGGRRFPGHVRARRVVLSAGSLGSTELLLRSRDQYRTLDRLSARLGHAWSTNGDFLTPAFYTDREPHPTRGPTITSVIDFLDGSRNGHRFWVQDGGLPDLLDGWLQRYVERPPRDPLDALTQTWVRGQLQAQAPLKNCMPWFAQGIDQPDGRFRLGPRWRAFGPLDLQLDWDVRRGAPLVEEIVSTHEELSRATGGHPAVPASWSLARYLITPHPLGGCAMADSPELGVVDRKGEVFGHPHLYVVDGAMFPGAVGVNPSRTIAGLAEFCAEQILEGG